MCVTLVAKDSLIGLCYELESMSEHICQAEGCPTLEKSASNKEVLESVLIWFRDAGTTYLQSFCDWQGAKPRTLNSQLVSSVLCNMSCQTPVQSHSQLETCTYVHMCVWGLFEGVPDCRRAGSTLLTPPRPWAQAVPQLVHRLVATLQHAKSGGNVWDLREMCFRGERSRIQKAWTRTGKIGELAV